ncbi:MULTISPECIES: MarR family winged helix-turn-helix transcriptional regulator [unclassified Romboutsia]|uniref:MarR family winged helix-turn-helix transcriptional regulator n=1 Tax=unclassified Romboutsia TaxID=2626894 RepID=UPI000822D8BA|nr:MULTISPECIES: MarR family transcriptional regulator [unclassified Romboutsia]SCH60929.1 Multidrug resistance operon repressor [uncultured Clostridium sp.]
MELNILSRQIWAINKDFRRYAEDILKEHNITLVSLRYLIIIKRMDGLNLQDIASLLNVDKAIVTRTIKKLVDLGLVDKVQDSSNSRSYSLHLTKKGDETVDDIKSIFKDWYYHVTSDFTEKERRLYENFVERIYANRIHKDNI